MIDPHNIPAGKMTSHYLEEWILFGILVANKPAVRTAKNLDAFLKDLRKDVAVRRYNPVLKHRRTTMASPFELVVGAQLAGNLRSYLEKHRFGQYTRIEKAFHAAPNLPTMGKSALLTIDQLESIHGIGMKTARMIMMYYKPGSRVAPLDTHILKFLREKGYDAPKITPSSRKQYLALEKAFLNEADNLKLTPLQLDKQVWQQYAIQ
jgi:hypothetical protein